MTDGYPDNTNQSPPIDERCTCKHPKSQHINYSIQPTKTLYKKISWHPNNHGQCSLCNCKQFTWAGWIYK